MNLALNPVLEVESVVTKTLCFASLLKVFSFNVDSLQSK